MPGGPEQPPAAPDGWTFPPVGGPPVGGPPVGGTPAGGTPAGGASPGRPQGPPDQPPVDPSRPGPPPSAGRRPPNRGLLGGRSGRSPLANLSPAQREDLARANRKVFRFGLLMLGAMVALTMPLPWMFAGLGLWAWGVVVAISGLRLARRIPGANTIVFYLALGLGFSSMVATYALATVGTLPIQWQYQQCQATALTIQAQDQCLLDRDKRMAEMAGTLTWQGLLGGGQTSSG